MQQNSAEQIALRALAWLAGNDDLLPVFLGASGASLADLKAQAADPEFQASVLDFLLMDDAWVIACCDALSLPYESLGRARVTLPGGVLPDWT